MFRLPAFPSDRSTESRVVERERWLARLASEQQGVVSRGQLERLGFSNDWIARAIRSGRLIRLHRGVYAVGHRALSPAGELIAATLAVGPDSAIARRSGLAWWGLVPPGQAQIDVLVPGKDARSTKRLRVRTINAWHPGDVVVHEGVRVTSVALAMLDWAGMAGRKSLEKVMEEAEIKELLDTAHIEQTLRNHPNRRGARTLSLLVAQFEIPDPVRSRLEKRLLKELREAGHPPDRVNDRISLDGRHRERDFIWTAERVILETDGWRTHKTRAAFEDDRSTDLAAAADGWLPLRTTWRALQRDTGKVVDQVISVLTRTRNSRAGFLF